MDGDGRYVSLASLRKYVQIGDNIADPQIAASLHATEDQVDEFCRRGPDGQPRPFVVPDLGVDPIARLYDASGFDLSVDDVVKVDAVEVDRGGGFAAVDAEQWELYPLNADVGGRPFTQLVASVPLTGRVRVTGWFGWPVMPARVPQATLLQASRLINRRNAPFGIARIGDIDAPGMRLLARLDADVELLLRGLQRHAVLV